MKPYTPNTISELVAHTLSSTRKNYSWRVYGDHGQYRRAMRHRFDVKDGYSIADVMCENICRNNSLLKRLQGKQ